MLPEGAHRRFIRPAPHIIGSGVICTGNDQQLAERGAGVAVFKRHAQRNEVVVLAVDQKHRHLGILERLDGGVAAGRGVQSLFAQSVGDKRRRARGQAEILFHHILPDLARRSVGRVGDHAAHRVGQHVARGHQHRRAAERHAHQIDGKRFPKAFRRPHSPIHAVVALRQTKADVVALALVLRALLHVEHAALLAFQKV